MVHWWVMVYCDLVGWLYRSWRFGVAEKVTSYWMGVLHSTHPMQQASSKWSCQASSCHDVKCQAWNTN